MISPTDTGPHRKRKSPEAENLPGALSRNELLRLSQSFDKHATGKAKAILIRLGNMIALAGRFL